MSWKGTGKLGLDFDNTLLTDFASCPARGVARHVFGLSGVEDKIAADVGNVFHKGLETHFMGGSVEEVMRDFEAEYTRLITYPVQEDRYLLENVKKIMGRFVEIRPVEGFPFVAVEAEKTIGVKLGEVEGVVYRFWMKRDLLVKDKLTGMESPLDHKTTGKISSWWSDKFRLASQLSGYAWGTEVVLRKPVDMVYVNAIEVSKVPDSRRKCPTHKVPYEECGVEHCRFELLTFARKPTTVEAWRQSAVRIANEFKLAAETFGHDIEMLKFVERRGAFTDSCTFCEFKKWCLADFSPKMMAGMVVENRWKPWEGGEYYG